MKWVVSTAKAQALFLLQEAAGDARRPPAHPRAHPQLRPHAAMLEEVC